MDYFNYNYVDIKYRIFQPNSKATILISEDFNNYSKKKILRDLPGLMQIMCIVPPKHDDTDISYAKNS